MLRFGVSVNDQALKNLREVGDILHLVVLQMWSDFGVEVTRRRGHTGRFGPFATKRRQGVLVGARYVVLVAVGANAECSEAECQVERVLSPRMLP